MTQQPIKKIGGYINKLARYGSFKNLQILLRYVSYQDWARALMACLKQENVELNFKYRLGRHHLRFFLEVLKCQQKKIDRHLYLWEYQGKQVYANEQQFFGLYAEYLKGVFNDIYHYDWMEKCVLDVGGFVGDSARFFLEQGAKHVVIYEPIAENVHALNHNLNTFSNQFEVHQKAIAYLEGEATLSSSEPAGSLGFGMGKGEHVLTCQAVTLLEALTSHSFDVAKIDCEGGEQYLIHVPTEVIQTIPYWMVETHSPEIYRQICQKFLDCRFSIKRDISLNPTVHLIHFSQ